MKVKSEKKSKLLELIEGLEKEADDKVWDKIRRDIVICMEIDLFKFENKKKTINFFKHLLGKDRNTILTDKLIFEAANNEYGKECKEEYKEYNEKEHKLTLKNLKTHLYKVLKDFLALKKYIKLQEEQEAAYERDYFVLETLRELKLKSLFEKDLKKIQNDYSKQTVKGVAFLLNAIRLEEMVYQKSIILGKRSEKTNLETLINRIEEHYLLLKSKYAVAGLTKEYSTSEKYAHEKLDALKLNGLDSTFRSSNNLLLKIYYELFLLYTVNDRIKNKIEAENEKQEHSKKIFKLLIEGEKRKEKEEEKEKRKEKLSRQELRNAYAALLIYFHQKVANWELDYYLKEVFNVYKHLVETDYIFMKDNGEIDFKHFKNIANIASSLNKVEWLEKFIRENKYKIRITSKEEAKKRKEIGRNELFIEVILAMAKKDYDRAGEMLNIGEEDAKEEKIEDKDSKEELPKRQRPKFDDFYDNADYRVFELKVFYEKKHITSLEYALKAFRDYLKNNKINIPTDQYNVYRNFINLVESLKNNMKSSSVRKTITSLKNMKEKYKPIKEHKWLLEKVEELEKLKKLQKHPKIN